MRWCWVFLAAACSNPQAATPIPEPPALDPGKVGSGPMLLGTDNPFVTLEGEPGATAARAVVRVTNLDDTAPPLQVKANGDGSFRIDVELPLGDEVRLQAMLGAVRGASLDFWRTADGSVVPSPRHECFRVTSGPELEFAGADGGAAAVETEVIELENACEEQATIDSSGTRLGLTAFALGTSLPLVVPPQASATVLVERDSSVTRAQEDVLFLTVSIDGTARRYPITLFAPAR